MHQSQNAHQYHSMPTAAHLFNIEEITINTRVESVFIALCLIVVTMMMTGTHLFASEAEQVMRIAQSCHTDTELRARAERVNTMLILIDMHMYRIDAKVRVYIYDTLVK